MSNNWFTYSLVAAVLLAASFLFVKRASLAYIPVEILTLYMWGIATVGLLGYLLINKQNVILSPAQLGIVTLAALTFLFGALLLNKGVYTAPNPGFATAVGSIQVLIVVFTSVLLFGSDFTIAKVLGSIAVIVGVILLGM